MGLASQSNTTRINAGIAPADFERFGRREAGPVARPHDGRSFANIISHDYPAALKSLLETEGWARKEKNELARAARLHLALVLIKLHNFEKAISTLFDLTRIDKEDHGYHRHFLASPDARSRGPRQGAQRDESSKLQIP